MVYNVFLATPFERHELSDESRYGFYEKIEDALKNIGKTTFLCHRELPNLKYPAFTTQTAIPRSDLVVADVGIPSHAVGVMLQQVVEDYVNQDTILLLTKRGMSHRESIQYLHEAAKERGTPIFTFNQEGEYNPKRDLFFEGFLKHACSKRIVFRNYQEGLDKITNAVREFYK